MHIWGRVLRVDKPACGEVLKQVPPDTCEEGKVALAWSLASSRGCGF